MANPLPLLLPAIDLLDAIGQKEPAAHIRRAVETVLCAGQVRTRDLGGQATTTQVGDAVAAKIG